MSIRCIRCYVSGKVQGVFYRASTRKQAIRLGLCGYVRNLPDGRVEVLACGETRAIDALVVWLRRGPSQSRVTAVEVESAADPNIQGFDIV
ncbi:acylphosphatase [Nitrococcus mobilis]|uniref:acylphosphatase n=1 Tax=Nitrococcus mobilis Nb-231 TaxID=314278 RepID=A4BSN2_9GAMM|nr:acylphosphatase [Nitrococcus mobilis]EAR21302.1 Acylphosphatase [Nitrococcus mobilis Nb-231]